MSLARPPATQPRLAPGLALTALLAAAALPGCGAAAPANSASLRSSSARIATAGTVAVSPLSGTPDASPETQISFLGAAPTQVADVHVAGSRSGAHAGTLRPYSNGAGASFLPAHSFVAGEHVTASASVTSGGSSRQATTTFTIARQATVSQQEFPLERGDPRSVQHYSTAPSLTPSSVAISTGPKPGASPGDLFLAPYQGKGSPGPMITDQRGGLVWFDPLPRGEQASNFQVQQFAGRLVLTWWQGRIIRVGFGEGEDVVYDDTYHRIATIRAGNGYHADLHALRLSGEGTAWIDVFDPIHANLSSVHGGAHGILLDSVVQEIDVRTGLVMWEWHALGHIPFSESQNPPTAGYPWDYAHLNSADPGDAGDVLMSVRNTWTVYDVDLSSGAINWRLGGPRSSFRSAASGHFYWQHDAELQPGGMVSLFDNGSDPPKERQSRGLLLLPDTSARSVATVQQFINPRRRLLAESQGNMLSLPGGNWLLGYGRLPNFTEFDSSGHVLLDGTLGANVQNFDTFLSPWSGHPTTRPSLLAQPGAGGALNVAVSWNGATDVSSWRVLAGSSPDALAPALTAPKTGFQTTLRLRAGGPYVAVQALDSSGAVLGSSATARA